MCVLEGFILGSGLHFFDITHFMQQHTEDYAASWLGRLNVAQTRDSFNINL